MNAQWGFPASVVTLWHVLVVLALLVLVPTAVYWLPRPRTTSR